MLKYCFFYLLIDAFSLNGLNSDYMPSMSKLNTIELENHKYQIEIDSEMKIDFRLDTPLEAKAKQNLDYIQVRSKHGQLYECKMPITSDVFDEDADEESSRSGELAAISSFFGHSHSSQHGNHAQKFNFSLIDEKLDSFKKDITNMCIYRVKIMDFFTSVFYLFNILCKQKIKRIWVGGLMNFALDALYHSITCKVILFLRKNLIV